MSRAAVDIARATVVDHAHSLRWRASGINLIINYQRILSLDATNNAHRFGHAVIAQATLLDDGKRRIETVRELARLLSKALIGGDNCEVIHSLLAKITSLDNLRGQFINGNIEKALNLSGVHIHRQNPVRTRDSDAVSNQAGGDWHAGLILLIGATIGIIRDNGGDTSSGSAFERIDHNQQFHNRAIHGCDEWLNHK